MSSSESRLMLKLSLVRLQRPQEEKLFAVVIEYPIHALSIDSACDSAGRLWTVPPVIRGGAAHRGKARKQIASIFVFMVD